MPSTPPRWDLSNVYPGLESEEFNADLAARFGIDIRSRKFWEGSLAVIGRRIERYCAL